MDYIYHSIGIFIQCIGVALILLVLSIPLMLPIIIDHLEEIERERQK